jgi:hypothetical protein
MMRHAGNQPAPRAEISSGLLKGNLDMILLRRKLDLLIERIKVAAWRIEPCQRCEP